jgi:hypothetical protein
MHMVIVGVISGVIVAAGTIVAGAISVVKWIERGAERRVKDAENQAKLDQMAATLEELRKRQAGER